MGIVTCQLSFGPIKPDLVITDEDGNPIAPWTDEEVAAALAADEELAEIAEELSRSTS